MVSLHRKHGSRGLEIVAFPCNQFGGQEPGSAEDIAEFTATREVAFTVMAKIDVNGPAAAPIYKFLKKASNTGDPRCWCHGVAPPADACARRGVDGESSAARVPTASAA